MQHLLEIQLSRRFWRFATISVILQHPSGAVANRRINAFRTVRPRSIAFAPRQNVSKRRHEIAYGEGQQRRIVGGDESSGQYLTDANT